MIGRGRGVLGSGVQGGSNIRPPLNPRPLESWPPLIRCAPLDVFRKRRQRRVTRGVKIGIAEQRVEDVHALEVEPNVVLVGHADAAVELDAPAASRTVRPSRAAPWPRRSRACARPRRCRPTLSARQDRRALAAARSRRTCRPRGAAAPGTCRSSRRTARASLRYSRVIASTAAHDAEPSAHAAAAP